MKAECGVSIARLHTLQIRGMQGKPFCTTTKLAKAGKGQMPNCTCMIDKAKVHDVIRLLERDKRYSLNNQVLVLIYYYYLGIKDS